MESGEECRFEIGRREPVLLEELVWGDVRPRFCCEVPVGQTRFPLEVWLECLPQSEMNWVWETLFPTGPDREEGP